MIKLSILGAAIIGVLTLGSSVFDFKGKPDVIWQTKKIEITAPQGSRVSADISFLINKDLENVSIRVTPEIEPYVLLTPNFLANVQAGSVIKPQVIFAVPEDIEVGTYGGTIQIRGSNKGKKNLRAFARPLPVVINVIEKPTPPPGEQLELFHDDGTAEAFDFDPFLGRAGSFSKFDISGQTIKIISAKIYLKVVTKPPSPIDVYVWDFERNRLLSSPPASHRLFEV